MPTSRKGRTIIVAVISLMTAGVIILIGAAGWGMRAADFRSATHLKHLGIAFVMYAQDDYYPELSPEPGRLMFDLDAIYPEYQSDLTFLISPADPDHRRDHAALTEAYVLENCSYWYLGYVVWDDETVEAFADAYRLRIAEGSGFQGDLPVDSPIERFTRLDGALRRYGMMSDEESRQPKWEYLRHPESELPVLIERPHPYPGPLGLWLGIPIPLSKPVMGGTVLYKDGHTEFIPYPGKWPMTERTISTLSALSVPN